MNVIDRKGLLERCMGMPAIMEGVLTQFQELGDEMLADVEKQIDARSWEDAAQAAHSLKGAAGSISAIALQNVAAEIEAHARNADADACNILRATLQREMSLCMDEIPTLLKESHFPTTPKE